MESYIKKKLSSYPVLDSPKDGDLVPCIVSNGDGTFSQYNIPYSSLKGAPGSPGTPGTNGTNGQGVPTGGSTGQVLKKNSNSDFDTTWGALDKNAVGLGNVDNTSDVNKPVSTAVTAAINAAVAATKSALYPIGSIYTNATDATDPATLLGFGTWAAFATGRVPVGKAASGTFATAGATGGEETHILTIGEVPRTTGNAVLHGGENGSFFANASGAFTAPNGYLGTYKTVGPTGGASSVGYSFGFDNGGGNGAHNNLQPYVVVYMWRRTA